MSENQKGGTLDSISLSAEVVIHTRPPENHEIYNLIGRVSSEWAQLGGDRWIGRGRFGP